MIPILFCWGAIWLAHANADDVVIPIQARPSGMCSELIFCLPGHTLSRFSFDCYERYPLKKQIIIDHDDCLHKSWQLIYYGHTLPHYAKMSWHKIFSETYGIVKCQWQCIDSQTYYDTPTYSENRQEYVIKILIIHIFSRGYRGVIQYSRNLISSRSIRRRRLF